MQRRLAALGLAVGAALVLALHVLEPSFDPLHRFMSEYVLGRFGVLMRVAFFVLAGSSVLLARAIAREHAPAVAIGLYGYALGMVLAGIFQTDATLIGAPRTPVGIVHDLAADLAFASLMLAAFASSARGRWLALAMFVTVVGSHAFDVPGLAQRAFALMAVTWQLTLALERPPR